MRKNATVALIISSSIVFLFSCKKVTDFLDKAPGIDVDENIVFSAKVETEKLVATLYHYGMPTIFPIRAGTVNTEAGFGTLISPAGGNFNLHVGITDEAEASETSSSTQAWNGGGLNGVNVLTNEDGRYILRWYAIRVANTLLERVDEVPDADQSYKDMVKGEALFIRALSNFEIFKRYGGFPLVASRIQSLEESKIPRSSLAQCIDAIVQDCDNAALKLPVNQPSAFTGRAHKGAALALKARTLLYAASPLFNTGNPYISYGNPEDDKLICYGSFDNNRWKLAADAAKAVLDWAGGAGYYLIDDPSKRIPVIVDGQKVIGNYRTAWEQNDNPEVILASKIWGGPKLISQFPWQHLLPRNTYVPNAGGTQIGTSITLNFVRKYEKKDGTPQSWDLAGGNDLLNKYAELDARFAQTVVYVGARLHSNVTRTQIWQGSLSDKNSCKGGAWLLKFVNDALPQGPQTPNCPIFRINEMLLNYAEALNEYSSSPPNEAFDAVNKIRTRSGMPDLPKSLSKDEFRQRIHNERDIELAFEDHRLFDIRRWMIAEQDGVMTGRMWGLEINRLNNNLPFPTAFSYKPFVFETRLFLRKMYLHPFITTEVQKGNLKQNPQW